MCFFLREVPGWSSNFFWGLIFLSNCRTIDKTNGHVYRHIDVVYMYMYLLDRYD